MEAQRVSGPGGHPRRRPAWTTVDRAENSACASEDWRRLSNFEKMVQKIVTSGNCLQFPEIPAKFRENFTEKTAISVDLQQNFEKICTNYENVTSQMCENLKVLNCKRCKSLLIL